METSILLESGTNELMILEFTVGKNSYGINVAKIKEIIAYKKPTPIPNAHPFIEGIFMPRDKVISVVDLSKCLMGQSIEGENGLYIVTNFNQQNVGFHVDTVIGIHRITWADITKPDATLDKSGNGIATGIMKFDKKLIIILDFEKIVSDISPETGLKISSIDHLAGRERNNIPVLIAEDSPFLRRLIHECLEKAGYTNVIATVNGKEAWDTIRKYKSHGNIRDNVRCVITDIEMPQMDGHRLAKLIKSDEELKNIPIIVFSSLVNEEMKRKGEALGIDIQLSKPEIGLLVESLDKLVGISE